MFEFAGVSALLLWFYCFTVMSIHPLVGGTTLIFFKIGKANNCAKTFRKFQKFCTKCSVKLTLSGFFVKICLKYKKENVILLLPKTANPLTG
jgi:hypothetical protein